MQKNDYCLGGEQSGHIIIKKYATTGDGILTAIMITEELCDSKLKLSNLTEALKLYPQHTKSVKVKDKSAAVNDPEVLRAVRDAEGVINGKGRVLLRQSGTEPVIRVMVESESRCRELVDMIASTVIERGHGV